MNQQTLKTICDAMRASYGAALKRIDSNLAMGLLVFETANGLRLIVERKGEHTAVYSYHAPLEGTGS